MDESIDASPDIRQRLLRESVLVTPEIQKRVKNFVASELRQGQPVPAYKKRLQVLSSRRQMGISENDIAVFRRELDQIQKELDVASGNSDQRAIMKCRDNVEALVPPGTERGAFYKARRDHVPLAIGPIKLSFDKLQNNELYKDWDRV